MPRMSSGGSCHDTGASARRRPKSRSRSSAGREQTARVESSSTARSYAPRKRLPWGRRHCMLVAQARHGPGRENKGGGMADRLLFVSWGSVVPGREEIALEVFNESVGLYGRMQQDGRIEGFDTVLLTPTGGIEGYFQVHGTAEQLAALREDPEWQRSIVDATLIVEDMSVVDGSANQGVADQMAMYQAAIARVPQKV